MAYEEFKKPVGRRSAGKGAPAINISKSQGALINKALALKIKLDRCKDYAVYIDRERKLLGVNVAQGSPYTASGSDKTNHRYICAGICAALQEMGVDTDVQQVFPAVTINLPAPLLCQIDLSKAIMKGGPR